jgi:hypothetical protein
VSCLTVIAAFGEAVEAKTTLPLALGEIAPLSPAEAKFYDQQSAIRDKDADIEEFECNFIAGKQVLLNYEAGAMGVRARINGQLVYFKAPGAPATLPKRFTSFDKRTRVSIVETKPSAASGITRIVVVTIERGTSKKAYAGQWLCEI